MPVQRGIVSQMDVTEVSAGDHILVCSPHSSGLLTAWQCGPSQPLLVSPASASETGMFILSLSVLLCLCC